MSSASFLPLSFPTVLTNLGEKMTDDEVDELLKAVDTSSGEINYTGMLFRFLPMQSWINTISNTGRSRTGPDNSCQLNITAIPVPILVTPFIARKICPTAYDEMFSIRFLSLCLFFFEIPFVFSLCPRTTVSRSNYHLFIFFSPEIVRVIFGVKIKQGWRQRHRGLGGLFLHWTRSAFHYGEMTFLWIGV